MNIKEKIIAYFKRFTKEELNTNYSDGKYSIAIADPFKRLASFLVDFFITTLIITFSMLFLFSEQIEKMSGLDGNKEKQEVTLTIDANNNIIDSKNAKAETIEKNGQKYVKLTPKEEESYKKLVNEIQNSLLFNYLVLLTPLIYNILFLLTKNKATIGQQIFDLRVVHIKKTELDIMDILNRCIIQTVCKVFPVNIFTVVIPMLMTKEKSTFYDYFTYTRVIEIKEKK